MTFFTLDKLKLRIPEIAAAAVRARLPLADVLTWAASGDPNESAMAPPPPPDAPGWRPLRPGERWGFQPGADPFAPRRTVGWWGHPADNGSNHWLRATLRMPEEWRGRSVLLALAGEDQRFEIEGIFYLDGVALAGLDEYHRAVLLPEAAHTGVYDLLIRCYLPFAQNFGGLHLHLRDDTIFRLGQAMRATLQAIETYRDSDPARHALLALLNTAYNTLDLRAGWQSEQFAESAHVALDLLRPPTTDHRPLTTEDRGLKIEDSSLDASEKRSSILYSPSSEESVVSRQLSVVEPPAIVATGHAHLDVAWLWPLWRTRQKVAHTVATALHLMERYPDYHFSMSQPQVYAYLQQDDPELYARLKQRAAEGRFEPVGMMWLEPDCNIPSGESLVRQLAQGARFFAEEFGVLNHIVWLPDVFGYSAALPQLMRGCGINCFMTTKISWNQFNRMPVDTFRWRGIDGSEVLTHFVTATADPVRHPSEAQNYTYVGHMTGGEVFGTWNHYRQKAINNELLYIYGWGDGGGGPTEEMLEAAEVFGGLPGFPRVRPGRVDQFFTQLYQRLWDDPRLPTWVGELYLEYHRGTYTSQARTKQANRAAELLYREAEWLNAWAATLGAPSQQAQLDAGWRITLLNQFHDILPGSSIPQVYIDSNAQFTEVQRIGSEVRDAALTALLAENKEQRTENKAPGSENQEPRTENRSSRQFVIFNSLPWQRRDVAFLPFAAETEPVALLDADGNLLQTQLVETDSGTRALLAEINVPSYGFTTLSTTDHRPPTTEDRGLRMEDSNLAASELRSSILYPPSSTESVVSRQSSVVGRRSSLENDALRLELNDHGEIASLYDLRHGRELAVQGRPLNQLVAYEDRPLNWDAWDIDIFYEEKPYPVREIIDWRVVEEGPLRAAIEITRRLGQSTIRQRICMWRGSPRIDFVTEVDWQERQTLLRALFPLAINATRTTCEIQFGAVERPTHRNTSWDWARFEVCAQRWVDLSEGDYGVALLNNGKYGHSLHHTTLGLSLLKGAIHPDPEADCGRHRFTYSLLPHTGDWRAAQIVRRAYELNAPLLATTDHRPPTTDESASVAVSRQSSVVGRQSSFLSTPTDHIVVETIKVADDGDGLIVRLYEAHNQRGPARLVFGQPVSAAAEVDLLEREVGPVAVAGNAVAFEVRPFEVKTLRVRLVT